MNYRFTWLYIMKKLILAALMGLFALEAHAGTGIGYSGPPLRSSFGFNDVTGSLASITNAFTIILFALAVIFFLVAGFNYLTSQGNEEKVKAAHKQIVYGLVALAVAVVSRGLVFFVQQIIG